MISLTEEEILGFNQSEAEEKLLYLRYLLMRETREADKKRYARDITMLERRITTLKIVEGTHGLPLEEA